MASSGALASREFRLLLGGQTLSWLGDAFQPIALSFAIIQAGGSVTDLGLVMASLVTARLLCTLVGGVWADRVRPQRVMILADLARAVVVLAMALAFLAGRETVGLLCLLAALSGAASAFFMPAMSSLKPTLVPVEQRQSANATLGLLQTTMLTVGPALAGVLVAVLGAPFGFAVNAVTFLVSAATVALIRTQAARSHRVGFVRELRLGWSAVRERDWLLWGVVAAAVYHVANGVVLITVNVLALRDLGGPTALGFIAAAEGLGGVVGSAVALRVRPRRPLVVGFLALGLMPIWVLAYVWPGVLSGVLLGAAVGYGGLMFFGVCWETAMQDHVPHHLLARVTSWDILASFVGMPLGQALAGVLGERYGVTNVLVACAVVIFVSGVAPLAVRGTRAMTQTSAQSPAAQVPSSALVDGPV